MPSLPDRRTENQRSFKNVHIMFKNGVSSRMLQELQFVIVDCPNVLHSRGLFDCNSSFSIHFLPV